MKMIKPVKIFLLIFSGLLMLVGIDTVLAVSILINLKIIFFANLLTFLGFMIFAIVTNQEIKELNNDNKTRNLIE